MKKSLLALAVLSAYAGIAQGQNSVTVYGRMDMGADYFDKVAVTGGRATGGTTMEGDRRGHRPERGSLDLPRRRNPHAGWRHHRAG